MNQWKEKFHAATENGTEPPIGRPTFIVAPPHLIDQWVDEISFITDCFNILLYYGDGRRQGAEFIKDKLTRKHSIFTGGIESVRTIIITSYQTLESRHGPQAVKAWCAKTKRGYDPSNPRMPISFPHGLSGFFGIAVFDEAHVLRNPLSGLSLACAWLNAGFRLLLTATPFHNGVRDFIEYQNLLLRSRSGVHISMSNARATAIADASPGFEDEKLLCSPQFLAKHILKILKSFHDLI